MICVSTMEEFNEKISSGLVMVDFFATWCGPCKMIAPSIEEIANEYEGRMSVVKVDVDVCPDAATKYGIYSIPTIMIFKDGEAKEKHVGFRAKSQLVDTVEKYL